VCRALSIHRGGPCRPPSDPPAVALLDIGLPGISGIAGIEPLKARYSNVLVLMITVHDDDECIFEAMCAGACGYLLKKTPPEKLVESVREVVAGGAPMSPEIARRVVHLFRKVQPPERADYHLTPHELRLLGMLVDGHNYKTAAAELGVTVHAVSFHMRRVYEKLRCTRSQRRSRGRCACGSCLEVRRESFEPAALLFQDSFTWRVCPTRPA
jgi:DNA-binding NarL/FixJ family response regulator